MKTLRVVVHLSDLHFGRTDSATLPALANAISAIKPDVVVVSGDLTQRARTREFEEARRFLDTLPQPQSVVPGNHDVPLYNVVLRWLVPLDKFRRYISKDLWPRSTQTTK
jgi:3',5'-cyclic AMP phosphodiesterase CpdA